ncbi:DUF2726 domain-containing protein [Vibrio ostreicida]|uniref:DUF2726 domain-containing protein n=1 Tax=Vibrio ostreicida TaxID=526588 RepID=UPI0035E4C738
MQDNFDVIPCTAEQESFPQHKRSSHLTTKNERNFHLALKQAIPSDYDIHCQVSLMALVQPVDWKKILGRGPREWTL